MPITTKWPRLVVAGQPVSEEQADEILIRTASLPLTWATNDHQLETTIAAVFAEFGAPLDTRDETYSGRHVSSYRAHVEWARRVGILDLSYLHNSRIASSWIGGPHGL